MHLSNPFYCFLIVPSPYTLPFMMSSINFNLMYEVHLHVSFELKKKKESYPVSHVLNGKKRAKSLQITNQMLLKCHLS